MRWIEIITESKSASLYHGTTADALLKMINGKKILGHLTNISFPDYKEELCISATRDKFLRYSSERKSMGGPMTAQVVIELNQQEISHNFKILPFHASVGIDGWERNNNKSESEEIIIVPNGLPFINRYIKSVILFPKLIAIYNKISVEELVSRLEALRISHVMISDHTYHSIDIAKHRSL